MSRLPLIGITTCSRQIGLHAYLISGDRRIRTVAVTAKGVPMNLPSLADFPAPSDILDGLDGILFNAPSSRFEPSLCHGPASARSTAHDSACETGVQWHPEWQVSSNPHYLAVFQASGDAFRKRVVQRDADAPQNLAYKSQETHA